MISFRPIFDRILIKRVDSSLSKKVAKAGLVLPDSIQDKYKASQGILVMCGEDCHDDVKELVGKQVLFARYSGDEITLNGEEFLLAVDRDIFGGVEDDTISE
jgi:chaperonin GroES